MFMPGPRSVLTSNSLASSAKASPISYINFRSQLEASVTAVGKHVEGIDAV